MRTITPASDGALLLGTVGDPHAAFVPRSEEAAANGIADGAETILVGCAYYGPLLRSVGYTEIPGTGVPMVDSTAVALKYLEVMSDIASLLGYVKSTRGYLRPPDPDALDGARSSLGLIQRSGTPARAAGS